MSTTITAIHDGTGAQGGTPWDLKYEATEFTSRDAALDSVWTRMDACGEYSPGHVVTVRFENGDECEVAL